MALRCRKNQATLTAQEKGHYVAAVLALKANGKYDQYVQEHINAMNDAHRGPAFLPWHREYLRRFELDLQTIDSSVTLPYWNWTVDNSPSSSLWDITFMGGDGRPSDGQVMTGPFAHANGNWTLNVDGPFLRRRFGISAPSLPTPSDVTSALNETVYDVAPYTRLSASGFRNRLEGWISGPQLHNLVHVWVGGSMLPMSSPNDPIFFLHHCFVDKLWADWQRLHPGAGYLPVNGAAQGHNLGDAMQPWAGIGQTVTPGSVLDHQALGYAYDTEPECRPKLKFRDDIATLKFRDDIPPTLKFRDDIATLKFRDDIPPTLKFRDDSPPTIKFRDDTPTMKFSDDGGTLKVADDGVTPGPGLPDPRAGVREMSQGAAGRSSAPFILATPHHSMAWTQSFPDAFQSALAERENALAQCEAAIMEREDAQRQGLLTSNEEQQLMALRQEYAALQAEYQQLAQHEGGCC
ncbi:MAG: tyrosinase family protein [Nitrospira sp.]|nr:tyrosinase family protein [Nitrospira sp.]